MRITKRNEPLWRRTTTSSTRGGQSGSPLVSLSLTWLSLSRKNLAEEGEEEEEEEEDEEEE